MRAQALFDSWPAYVWPENRTAVEVYGLCQWTIHASMSAWYQGISASEILAACELCGVERTYWRDVAHRIRIMVSAAQPILQEAIKK
jgi:hypothetical protein